MYLIGIDLDSTVVNLLGAWCEEYNKRYAPYIPKEKFIKKSWELETIPGVQLDQVLGMLTEPGFFRQLPPLAGAVEGVNRLRFLGNDIIFITHGPKNSLDDKVEWVERHFRWATPKDVMTTGRKDLVCLDVLIDDKPETIQAYREAWPDAKILTLAWPYNRHMKRQVNLMAEHGEDPESGWEEITDFIETEIWEEWKEERKDREL